MTNRKLLSLLENASVQAAGAGLVNALLGFAILLGVLPEEVAAALFGVLAATAFFIAAVLRADRTSEVV